MSERPPVVIVGADCPTGLQSARTFAARGVDVIGIAADPTHPCARSRAYRRMLRSASGGEGCVATLLHLAPELPHGAVLLPCTDLSVLEVSRHRASLCGTYVSALPPPDVVDLLLDKARFAEFTAARGFPVPRTRVLRARCQALEASRELRFPCALKPSVKTPSWKRHASAKVFVADSPESLLALYDRCSSWSEAMVVQEWIEGGDTDYYTCNCYLGADSEPLATFSTRKLRQWPPHGGQGCLSVECRNEIVRDTTLDLFRAAGHRGFGYLEMMWDEASGRHLILEANVGRPTGRSAAAEAAGVELLMTAYCDLLGLPLPEGREQSFRGAKWIHLRRDLQASARLLWNREQSVREIVRSWRGNLTFALLSWRDPVPFVADVARSLRKGAGRTAAPVAGTPRSEDFLVAGVVRVRVLGAEPSDIEAVSRDLGPPNAASDHLPPDITVHFEDRIAAGTLRLLDGGTVAWGDEGLYALGSRSGPVRAKLSVGEEWGRGRITCRKGLARVPFLAAMVDLAAVRRGWIPLHASAWIVEGTGVLAVGWARSGKTGAMLSFAEAGARPLADDRVFLSADGRRMAGVPRTVGIRDWHLEQLPTLAGRVGGRARRRARIGAALGGLSERAAGEAGERGSWWRKAVVRGSEKLRRRLGVELPLSQVGGEARGPGEVPVDLLLLLETHDDGAVACKPLEPENLTRRVTAMAAVELMPALQTQLFVRYSMEAGWTGAEEAARHLAWTTQRAISGRCGYVVRHPNPCSLEELRRHICGLLPAAGGGVGGPLRPPDPAGPGRGSSPGGVGSTPTGEPG